MKISIVDYGTGNIKSIFRAFKKFEANVSLVSKPEEIQKSTHLVLPGVGAFPKAIELLSKKNLIQEIKNHSLKGKPLLGICLGMQLLFSSSDEIIKTNGLDLIKGRVRKLPKDEIVNKEFKIPNVGWHHIKINEVNLNKTIYDSLDDLNFYFVHSYYCETKNDKNNLFYIKFNKKMICVIAKKDNIIGTQFHPEKSGENGLKLIEKFIRM
jgi:glutamine amidotransferase